MKITKNRGLGWLLCFSFLLLAHSNPVFAQSFDGFVKLPDGKELYTKYTPASSDAQPTIVLLSGLTYSTWQWQEFAKQLEAQGFGVLSYDMAGMGKNLDRHGFPVAPIYYHDQVEDLASLLKVLKIKGPYHLVGLSYGGGIAAAFAEAYPDRVKNLFLMAPYTEPLKAQHELILDLIQGYRTLNPFAPFTDEQLYDYFLRQIVYTTYPVAEPTALTHPFKLEAIFRMVQGIRKFKAMDSAPFFPRESVHLIVPSEDQYITQDVFEQFWSDLPQYTKGSYLYIHGAEHKVPQSTPEFSAGWIAEVVKGRVEPGQIFDGYPREGQAISGETVIQLPKGIRYVPF